VSKIIGRPLIFLLLAAFAVPFLLLFFLLANAAVALGRKFIRFSRQRRVCRSVLFIPRRGRCVQIPTPSGA